MARNQFQPLFADFFWKGFSAGMLARSSKTRQIAAATLASKRVPSKNVSIIPPLPATGIRNVYHEKTRAAAMATNRITKMVRVHRTILGILCIDGKSRNYLNFRAISYNYLFLQVRTLHGSDQPDY